MVWREADVEPLSASPEGLSVARAMVWRMAVTQLRASLLEAAPKVGLRLWLAGSPGYVRILQRAFPPPVSWYGPYTSFDSRFDSVVYMQGVEEDQLRRFLGFLSDTLFVETALDEAWALDMHMRDVVDRTGTGDLVFRAKTYAGKPGEPEAAAELAGLVAARAAHHPGINRAGLVVPVPANPPREPHNLPEVLAVELARAIGRPCRLDVLVKTRPTNVKDLPNEEKLAALADAYVVTGRLDGRSIVLVDDLLHSGSTLNHLGGLLRAAGTSDIIGFVATKTLRS
ncbi:MAG: hypothetical protein A2Y55_11950 [Actinobacteria bacterium RBG_16_68_12]|nr:MAG: hypothetical protein A2Y55_11950 [Actinobacteria bacterium RBG_16_68_12]